MIPFLAGAAVVALGATAIAYLLDQETDEERGRHDDLRRRNYSLRSQLASTSGEGAKAAALRRKQAALTMASDLREYCTQSKQRLERPAQEFQLLTVTLQSDLADKSISPFRRNALRLPQGRLEDASNRLSAYQLYCDWYMERLGRMLGRESYDSILDLSEPQTRLPEDWLYHGKVALASVSELCGERNGYGQSVELKAEKNGAEYSIEKQRVLMMKYPDQDAIPVQLLGGKNPRYFKACILRGALHVEHILEKLPCAGFVEKSSTTDDLGNGYWLRCYPDFCNMDRQQSMNGGLKAFLPASESSFPGKRYQPGERLLVYPHHYDLQLNKMTVTEQQESLLLAGGSSAPVFMYVDGSQYDVHPLLQDPDAVWQLRSFTEAEGGALITLQYGAWQLETRVCAESSQLCVTGLNCTGIDSVALDQLPFTMRLISEKLKDSVFCDALQFDLFVQFSRQQSLFHMDVHARKVSGQFFERWTKVTEFLIEEEGYRNFPLVPQTEPKESDWDCACTIKLDEELEKLIQDTNPQLFLEEHYITRSGEGRWLRIGELQGLPEALGGGVYRLTHRGIMRPAPAHNYQTVKPSQLRLRYPIRGDLANLGRQKRALQSFMSGRLLNRTLQQLLMMPERYVPQPDPYWTQLISEGLQWHDPNWIDPAKAITAKRVVEAALSETNLYLIQGPPGTGKTTCIVEMLHQITTANPDVRVLVVSQQNTAVDNALGRYLERHPHKLENVLRISRDPSKVQASVRPATVDAILAAYLKDRQQAYSCACIERSEQAVQIKEWLDGIYNPQLKFPFDSELSELLIDNFKLVGATCVGLASSHHGMDRLTFDVCIIDEGGRSTVPELLIPLMRSRKAIIIGDHYQLPPSISSRLQDADSKEYLPFLEETFLKTSFFGHLYENLPEACRGRLVEQFRMVEPIGDLVADLFYAIDGLRGLFNGKQHDRSQFLDSQHPLRWKNVEDGYQEKENGVGPSLLNQKEALAIVNYLIFAANELLERIKNKKCGRKSVAVITPYGAQKRLIRDLLSKQPIVYQAMDVEVDTVDSFQGSEADIVLYSTVRTQGKISFLLDRQRVNVACSRARENLVFFGSTLFLRQSEARNKKSLFSTIMERSKYDHRLDLPKKVGVKRALSSQRSGNKHPGKPT